MKDKEIFDHYKKYRINENLGKIFNEYKYYFPYYPYNCYLEYPFIKDEKFYEVNISYFEYIEINGIKKEIFENKSFNKKELKKKFEEKIEKIYVPTIKLDEIKKNFGEEIIKKFLNFKTIYEKKAKKTNNIIIQLNYLSTLIYEIFVELVINSEDKIPEYRGSYLESIGFSQSCEKFNQYYSCVNNFVNKFLFNKKFIIYLKKKIKDAFRFLESIQNSNDDNSVVIIFGKINFILEKIPALRNLRYSFSSNRDKIINIFDKPSTEKLIRQINLVKEQKVKYNLPGISLKDIESIETYMNAVKKIDIKYFSVIDEIVDFYNKIEEEITYILKED